MALLYDAPRTASIQAITTTHFAVLDKESYDEIIGNDAASDLENFIKCLKLCPMFTNMSKMSLCKMQYYFKTMNYLRNYAVFTQGEWAEDVFVIVEGDFILTR